MLLKRLLPYLFLVICLNACTQQPKPVSRDTKEPNYDKAVSFLDKHSDSAYYYFNKVVSGAKDSLLIARAYNNMAVIQYEAGDYFGAQEMLIRSLKFLDEHNEKHYRCLSSDYNELGLTYMRLKNFDAAFPLYDQAIRYAQSDDSKRIYINNKALTYNRKKDYVLALLLYKQILAEPMKSKKEYARSLSNMAITDWHANPNHNVAPLLLKALDIRKSENDIWGQNASFDHLSQYYKLTKPDSALFYANAMYTTAKRLDSPDDQLEALQKLIGLSPAELAKPYFQTYQRLSDSLQTARNSAKNQFALVRYDTEKNKADNLKLQKDNSEKKYEIIRKNILLVSTSVAFVLFAILGWFWYRKREQRIALSFSQMVHDEVANGLYKVMKRIEDHEIMTPGALLDEITVLYERSRDISHEKAGSDTAGFDQKIAALLTGFGGPDIKVAVAGNNPELWELVSAPVKTELEHVLLELMVNMRKHSRATLVVVNFKQVPDQLEIIYSDNGVGFPPNMKRGKGLNNTENRMNAIKGNLTFEKPATQGVRIHLFIPLYHDVR